MIRDYEFDEPENLFWFNVIAWSQFFQVPPRVAPRHKKIFVSIRRTQIELCINYLKLNKKHIDKYILPFYIEIYKDRLTYCHFKSCLSRTTFNRLALIEL